MFSLLATCYLFLGGAGAGALVVLCVLECANARRRFGNSHVSSRLGRTYTGRAMGSLRAESSGRAGAMRYYEDGYTGAEAHRAHERYVRSGIARALALPSEFFKRAWPVCLVTLAMGVLCLMADLGRPDRLLGFLVHPHFSAITVGAYALAAALVIAAVFSALALFDGFRITDTLVYALSFAGAIAGLVSAVYTGVLLSGLASVLFWQTPLLPAVFTASSLSCGVALVLFAAAFVEVRQMLVRPLATLAFADSVIIVVEAALLAALLVCGWQGEDTHAAAYALVAGDLRYLFWGGLVVLGLMLPLVLERYVAYGNYASQLIWVAAAVLLGGFLLRWCVVGAGAYDVTQAASLAGALL